MSLTLDTKVAGDLLGVSSAAQSAASTAATLDKLLLFDEASGVTQTREAETNEQEKTGFIEATDVDVLSRAAEGVLTQDKATPDGVAWACRTVMGAAVSSTTISGTAKEHVFGLLNYPDEPDYFTVAHRKGGSSGADGAADYEQNIGVATSQIEFRCAKNEFASLGLTMVGLGQRTEGVLVEKGTGLDFTTPPTLVLAEVPKGSSDAERAANVDVWLLDSNGEPVAQVPVTTFLTDTITIDNSDIYGNAISGTNDVRVAYDVEPDGTTYLWKQTLEGLAVAEEFKLKATNLRLYIGRDVDYNAGSPTLDVGGQYAGCELDDFVWTLNRNAEAGRCWRVADAAESEFAQQVELGDFIQRVTLNRKVRDYFSKMNVDGNHAFGMEIEAYGPAMPNNPGVDFRVRLLFDKCKILTPGRGTSDGKWRDELEIAVLKRDAATPTAFAVIRNEVAAYA